MSKPAFLCWVIDIRKYQEMEVNTFKPARLSGIVDKRPLHNVKVLGSIPSHSFFLFFKYIFLTCYKFFLLGDKKNERERERERERRRRRNSDSEVYRQNMKTPYYIYYEIYSSSESGLDEQQKVLI